MLQIAGQQPVPEGEIRAPLHAETIVANESGPNAGVEGVPEDVKGRAKEAFGAITGNESV